MGGVWGVTGTKVGATGRQVRSIARVLRALQPDEFHHGDCIGVDSLAHDLYSMLVAGPRVVVHPPEDDRYRARRGGAVVLQPKPYLDRDRDIVAAAVDGMIVVPRQDHALERGRTRGEGTWTTYWYARDAGRPVVVVWPDGATTLWDWIEDVPGLTIREE